MNTQVAKNTATFRHIGHAHVGDGIGCVTLDGLALKRNIAAARLDQAGDAFKQRGFTHAIAPHEAHGLSTLHIEIQVAQHMAGTVKGIESPYLQKHIAHAVVSPR